MAPERVALDVLWSRIARPYGIVALLCSASVFVIISGLRSGDNGSLRSGAVLAALAIWFQPLSLFTAIGIVVTAVVALMSTREPRERFEARAIRDLVVPFLVTLAATLSPAIPSLVTRAAIKFQGASASLFIWVNAGQHLAGTRWLLLAVILLATGAAGAMALARGSRAEIMLLLLPILLQLAGVLLLSPRGIDNPVVLARYLVFGLPILLLFVAAGFSRMLPPVKPVLESLSCLALASFLLLSGPLPDLVLTRSSLAHHESRLAFTKPLASTGSPAAEALGSPILRQATRIAYLVPAPISRSFPTIEAVDRVVGRRAVLVLLHRDVLRFPGIELRNSLTLHDRDDRLHEIDALVVAPADLPLRWKRPRGRPISVAAGRSRDLQRIVARFGQPDEKARGIWVWDMRRGRALAPRAESHTAEPLLPHPPNPGSTSFLMESSLMPREERDLRRLREPLRALRLEHLGTRNCARLTACPT